MYTIFEPKSKKDMESYFKLRWILLRRPWGGKRGTELDNFEENSFHRAVKDSSNNIIGTARIHFIDGIAQIRYMAIKKDFWNKGIGSRVIIELEKIADKHKIKKIFLNSRDNAVKFYKKNGYRTIKKVNSSFGDIVHYRMEKVFNYD